VYEEVNVVGVYNPPDTNDPDIVTSVTGQVFVAKTPEAFTYDDDGNLLSDGRFSYSWDSENRLIGAETLTSLPSSVPRKKLEFAYDYMSRRVSKKVYARTTNDWSLITDHLFIYDGWNLVRDLQSTASSLQTNSSVWGLDLSGSFQGAGGVGGLLSVRLGTNNVCYTYDANGNVSELINSTGGIDAHYEFSPFGETIVATGPLAKENLFRFSTKYFVDELGIGDWGMRWYSPSMGRWLVHDPLTVKDMIGGNPLNGLDGYNLYAYVWNSPVDYYDVLGLFGAGQNGGNPNSPRGHGDFYGSGVFDYNAEDSNWSTSPFNPASTWRHFRDLNNVEDNLMNSMSTCDKDRFDSFMHQGQDYFSHRAQGYTIGHLGGPNSPDNDDTAWQDANNWTYNWVDSWKKNCCSDPCKPGKFKRCSN